MNGFILPRYELRKLKFSRGVIFSDNVAKERISANRIAMFAWTWSPRLTSRISYWRGTQGTTPGNETGKSGKRSFQLPRLSCHLGGQCLAADLRLVVVGLQACKGADLCRSSSGRTGLTRKSTAPAFSAFTLSPSPIEPVTMTMGMARVSSSCDSATAVA